MREYSALEKLIPENIDRISEELVSFLKSINTNYAEVTRLRLSVEEVLLRWRESLT